MSLCCALTVDCAVTTLHGADCMAASMAALHHHHMACTVPTCTRGYSAAAATGVYAVPVSPRMPLQVDSGTGINSQSVAAAGQPVPMKSVHLTYYVHASQAVSAATVTPATTCAYIVGGTCPTGIEYNEGPIMRGPLELVPIFYGTSWTARQMSIIRMFLSGLGGSTWMAVNAAYGDNTQWGANNRMMNSTLSYNFNTLSNKLPQGRNLSDSAVRVKSPVQAVRRVHVRDTCLDDEDGGR